MAEPRPFNEHPKQGSAISGCLIPIVMVLVVTIILGIAGYSFYQQDKQISQFASPLAEDLTPTTALPAAKVEMLRAKLASSPQELTLSSAELNHFIQTLPELAELKTMVRVDSVKEEGIHATVSLPLRSLPGKPPRFLNAAILTIPRVEDAIFFFDLTTITVPEKSVPTGFHTGLRQNRYLDAMFLTPFEEQTALWERIQSVTAVELKNDALTLRWDAIP